MPTELRSSPSPPSDSRETPSDSNAGPSPSEYSNVLWEWEPLDRVKMQELHDQDKDGWINKIIGRCNYWLFDYPSRRGGNYANDWIWKRLYDCSRVPEDSSDVYSKPNDALNHPPEEFLKKFVGPFTPPEQIAYRDILPIEGRADINSIKDTLEQTLATWGDNKREKDLQRSIDAIPNPHLIKKVVCFEMKSMKTEAPPEGSRRWESTAWEVAYKRSFNQHAAAVMLVDQLQRKTGQEINLYVADLEYGELHKEFFRTWSWPSAPSNIRFIPTDTAYNKHEAYTLIDDNTFVVAIHAIPARVGIICSEYARPVAFMSRAIREGPDGKVIDLHKDIYWTEVEHEGNKHAIPGPGRNFLPARVHKILESEYTIAPEFEYTGRRGFNEDAYWGGSLLYIRKDTSGKSYTPTLL